MKNISNEEFEQYIIDMTNGEKTQRQVVKELETDTRTLNVKIQELYATNPELYSKYVEKRAYRPKENKSVKTIELAYEVLKDDRTLQEIADEYNIGIRTLRRRIEELKNSPDLIEQEAYSLCKTISFMHAHGRGTLPEELKQKCEKMLDILKDKIPTEKVSSIEIRRQELLKIEKEYHTLCGSGMSKTEAAAKMGYTRNRIYKLLNELYQIEIQKQVIEGQSEGNNSFRASLKVDTTNTKQAEPRKETSDRIQGNEENQL